MLDLQRLHAIAARVKRAHHQAAKIEHDDLVQIGALAALERRDSFDKSRGTTLSTWLAWCAEWAMREAVMRLARRHRLAPITFTGEDPDLVDEAPGPEALVSAREQRRELSSTLRDLPAADRELLCSVYWQDSGFSDLGRAKGVTRNAIWNAHAKVIGKLREALAD